MRTVLAVLTLGAVAVAGHGLLPAAAGPPTTPAAPAAQPSQDLVVHEWGTFTSFSGSDGTPVGFRPNNTDLPSFVYYPFDDVGKGGRLYYRGGLVSMETPVLYFYTAHETRVNVTVDFPRGWITEWYPFASGAPVRTERNDKAGGQSIRWAAKLTPGEPERFPKDKSQNHYYAARETDAVPLQVEVNGRDQESEFYALRGGSVVQREKFLFYRGVGTFAPPVTVKALGGGQVRVVNASGGTAAGLVLLTVRDGKIGFRALPDVEAGASATATLPEVGATAADLAGVLVKSLTAAGLFEREARAMVKTWESAWFKEEGTRLLYLVPRAKTDELLPLKVDPKPSEVVRVLVGRHDFLTPEQEADAVRELRRVEAARAELDAAERALQKLGRFAPEARQLAGKRLAAQTAGQK